MRLIYSPTTLHVQAQSSQISYPNYHARDLRLLKVLICTFLVSLISWTPAFCLANIRSGRSHTSDAQRCVSNLTNVGHSTRCRPPDLHKRAHYEMARVLLIAFMLLCDSISKIQSLRRTCAEMKRLAGLVNFIKSVRRNRKCQINSSNLAVLENHRNRVRNLCCTSFEKQRLPSRAWSTRCNCWWLAGCIAAEQHRFSSLVAHEWFV